MDSQDRVSVEDVRKLALPLGTRVIAGNGLLQRHVAWTTVVYPENGTLPKTLQNNEMIIIATPETGVRQLPDLEILRWACDHDASAVVLNDPPNSTIIAEATAYNMPLLALPPSTRVRVVEKAIVSLLVDRKGQIERRGTQIYRQLTQISSRNEGIQDIINAMARLTNKAIVVQDKRLQFIGTQLQPQSVGYWEDVELFLKKVDNVPVEIQDRQKVVEIDNPVIMQSLPTPGLARFVAPIISKDMGRGFLSIIGRDSELDDIDQLVAEHGAAACAIEMAKAKAISDTEKRLRGTFLDRVLIGDVTPQEAMKQGERLEHDMTQTHVALVLAWRGDKTPSLRRLETTINALIMNNQNAPLVWTHDREGEVIIFHALPKDAKEALDQTKKFARSINTELHQQYPSAKVSIGVGTPVQDVTTWRTSYDEARQALGLATRLGSDQPLYIGDLGAYQLIISLSDKDKLQHFCQRALGALLDYDHKQNADLIKTLEAFFECHGNLSQTAEALIVHRNTLLYRMSRINEIAQIDLERPEIRLGLHLALAIRRLLPPQ